MSQQVETPPATPFTPITPNDHFRRIRTLYLKCVGLAIPLLFLAFFVAANKIGGSVMPVLLIIAGVGLLFVAMMARAGAHCPRCLGSLIWRSGPIGTGRISLGLKKYCPHCGLDLDQPWVPEPEENPSPEQKPQ